MVAHHICATHSPNRCATNSLFSTSGESNFFLFFFPAIAPLACCHHPWRVSSMVGVIWFKFTHRSISLQIILATAHPIKRCWALFPLHYCRTTFFIVWKTTCSQAICCPYPLADKEPHCKFTSEWSPSAPNRGVQIPIYLGFIKGSVNRFCRENTICFQQPSSLSSSCGLRWMILQAS
jgi:hypothetical protein